MPLSHSRSRRERSSLQIQRWCSGVVGRKCARCHPPSRPCDSAWRIAWPPTKSAPVWHLSAATCSPLRSGQHIQLQRGCITSSGIRGTASSPDRRVESQCRSDTRFRTSSRTLRRPRTHNTTMAVTPTYATKSEGRIRMYSARLQVCNEWGVSMDLCNAKSREWRRQRLLRKV